jgi:type VI secretion system protein ImpL
MKKILAIFKQRWLISLVGLFAIAIVIWFIGPFFAFADHKPLATTTSRLVTILVIVVLWGLNNLRINRQAVQTNNQIIDGLVKSAPLAKGPTQSEEEVAALKRRFEEAMEVLKESRRKKGVQGLYELPWYIIIGPPASGKTTALANSGLNFPLAERFGHENLKFQGVGGTRNCDWWFTNEAVLLDTAGRYVTQDSDAEVDRAAWAGFLDLLKNYRRRRPINGVIVAVSLFDLIEQSEYDRSSHVKAIKQRIHELYKHFRISFPIYFVLTKCDLIAGFTEFFSDLDVDDRKQVWGFTFPLQDDVQESTLQRFGKEYDALLQRLNDRLLWRLSAERDLHRRTLIYSFPQQMADVKKTVEQFLQDIFRPSPYEETLLLRGIYFTSGTQEGTPVDRVMRSLARSFGLDQRALPRFPGHGRSYFIHTLLKDVIFPESGITGVNRREESRRAWIQRGAYIGAMILTLGALLGWSTSFTANKLYVAKVKTSVDEYRKRAEEPLSGHMDFIEILSRLDALRTLTAAARKYLNDVPLHMRLWLYQGDALGNAASDAYTREMNSLFIPQIAALLEKQIERSQKNPELQYEALKTYLMFSDLERMNPRHVELWMEHSWRSLFKRRSDVQTRLQTHLENLLQTGVRPISENEDIVAKARRNLRRISLAEFVYGRLKHDYLIRDKMPFTVVDVVGDEGQGVFRRTSGKSLDSGISGLFTYRGYHDVFKKFGANLVNEIRQDSWVLGAEQGTVSESELKQLDKDLTKLYLDEYIQVWKELLDDIEIVNFRSRRHAIEVLDILSGHSSPLRGLLKGVEHNTTLTRLPTGVRQLTDRSESVTGMVQDRLSRLFGNEEEAVQVIPQLPTVRVDHQFEGLNKMIRSEEGNPPPIDHVIDLISELYGHFEAMEGAGLLESPLQAVTGDALRRVRVEGARLPEPLKGWLLHLASNSRAITMGNAHTQLNGLWTADVTPLCHRMLDNRYPFNKHSSDDVTLEDFGQFFGHDGIMDQYFKNHLRPFVDTTKRPWRARSVGETTLGLSSEILRQFQRADLIRKTFFKHGGQQPSLTFSLKPVTLDKRVSRFILDIDGEQFIYRHGPTRGSTTQWPGQRGPHQVRVIFEDRNGKRHIDSEYGEWALFRILDRSNLHAISSNQLSATFEVDGRKAEYLIRADSVINPFLMAELQEFHCPANL